MGWKETVTEVAVSSVEGVRGQLETEKHNTEWELLFGNTTAPIRRDKKIRTALSRLLDSVFIDAVRDFKIQRRDGKKNVA